MLPSDIKKYLVAQQVTLTKLIEGKSEADAQNNAAKDLVHGWDHEETQIEVLYEHIE